MSVIIPFPAASEYSTNYSPYIQLAGKHHLLKGLEENENDWLHLLQTISEDKSEFSYAANKWSIKQIIAHVTDTERIFAYRALRFARNDQNPLSGFDENLYAPESNAHHRSKQELTDEWVAVRKATIELFKGFTLDMCVRKGVASNHEISVRALGYAIVGHTLHHQQVIIERYLAD